MELGLTDCVWKRQAVQYRNAVNAARADAEQDLSIRTSNALYSRRSDSQAAKEEDANKSYLPLPLHMKIPNMSSGVNTVAESAFTLNSLKIVAIHPALRQKPETFISHYFRNQICSAWMDS